jgi:hypothetical protein
VPICESAWGPDADRHVKVLIIIRLEGSALSHTLDHLSAGESRFAANINALLQQNLPLADIPRLPSKVRFWGQRGH